MSNVRLVRSVAHGLLGVSLSVLFVGGAAEWVVAQDPTSDLAVPAPTTDPDADDLFGDLGAEPTGAGAVPSDTEGPTAAGQEPDGPTEADVYREAMTLVEAGKCAEAIEKLSLLATQGRELVIPALFQRGKCFIELKETDLAAQSFATALQEMGRFAGVAHKELGIELQPYQILLEMGKLNVDTGRITEAIDNLAEAIVQKQSVPELFYYRGLALSKQADRVQDPREVMATLDAAVSSLDRALELKTDYPEAYFERGRAKAALAQQAEDWQKAIEDLEKARELDPDNRQYIVQLGFAHLQRARQNAARRKVDTTEVIDGFQKAILAFRQFIDDHRDHPSKQSATAAGQDETTPKDGTTEEEEDEEATTIESALVTRADARLALARHLPEQQRARQYELAIEDSNEAMKVDPRFPFALFNRARAWRLLDNYQQAIDDLTEVVELAPNWSGIGEARLRRGIAWYYLGEYELALGDFAAATITIRERDGRANFWAGAAHAGLGDDGQAVEFYSDALRENPDYTLAYHNRGIALLRLGRYERALEDFSELIRRDRTNARAYYYRGLAYEALGQGDAASQSFQKAAQLDRSLANRLTGRL